MMKIRAKCITAILRGVIIGCVITTDAIAALVPRAGGTMVYDTDRNLTWLADITYAKTSGYDGDGQMTWGQAVAWADQLTFGGYSDWRLPNTVEIDGTCSEGTAWYGVTHGYGCSGSEMGHLFYNELGGIAGYSLSISTDSDISLFHNFDYNLQYWSGTGFSPTGDNHAWIFNFNSGYQEMAATGSSLFAWAVRDGDVTTVPVPSAVWLFGSSLIGLIGLVRRKTDNRIQ